MTPAQIALVQQTFDQVKPIADVAAGLFYNRLFELDPSLRPMFRGDMQEQGRKLMQMLAVAVAGLTRLDTLVPAGEALGRRGVGYGVREEDYATVGGARLWALGLGVGDSLSAETVEFAPLAEQLHRDAIPFFSILPDGSLTADPPAALLSGSFNPLHAGHSGLAATAAALLGRPVAFELSAVNAEKPPLPPAAVLDRLSQFAGRHPVYAANAPTFNQKARLYPGAVFVVGFDTAERVIQPRYYGDSRANMLAALDELRARGNRFLVAGRLDDNGLFHGLPELNLPTGYETLFEAIPARLFRHDVSLTEIRAALKAEAEG